MRLAVMRRQSSKAADRFVDLSVYVLAGAAGGAVLVDSHASCIVRVALVGLVFIVSTVLLRVHNWAVRQLGRKHSGRSTWLIGIAVIVTMAVVLFASVIIGRQ